MNILRKVCRLNFTIKEVRNENPAVSSALANSATQAYRLKRSMRIELKSVRKGIKDGAATGERAKPDVYVLRGIGGFNKNIMASPSGTKPTAAAGFEPAYHGVKVRCLTV